MNLREEVMKGFMNGKRGVGVRRNNHPSRSRRLIASSVVIAAVVLVGLGTLAHNKPATPIAIKEAAGPAPFIPRGGRAAGVAVQTDTPRVEVEVVVLTPEGFQPAGIMRGLGPFILQVDNRTGIEQIEFTILQQGGNIDGPTGGGSGGGMIASATIGGGQIDWNSEYDLASGMYVLGVTGHPEWACPIIIDDLGRLN
jgi:hypothetical protein